MGDYAIPRFTNDAGKKNLEVDIPTLFNQIPPELRNIQHPDKAKNALKNYFLNKSD